MKRIKESAILFTDGKIYTGKRHHNVIATIVKETGTKRVGNGTVQGFVTEDGEFVTREEGAKIALAAGQVVTGKATVRHVFDGHTLYSEDLY